MDSIPESLLREDINISLIENMILDFDDNYETYKIMPIEGNIFPHIDSKLFSKIFNKIKKQKQKLTKINKNVKKYRKLNII